MTQKINYQPLKQSIKFLMRRHKSADSGLKMPKNYELKAIKLTTLVLTTFLVTLFAASILAPVQPSSASETANANVTANISATNYYLTLASSGTTLDINATPGGVLSAAVDTVNVKTNNPSGYKLYLSMNTNVNRLYLNGDSTSTSYFSPTSGTFLNPKTLDDNSWGYALAESDAAEIRTKLSQTAVTNFSESYSTTPDDNSTWAAVPIKGSDQLIKSTSSANEAGVDTNVYYAAKANVAQPSGTYKGTVLYTVIADSGAATDSASVSPTQVYSSTAGQSITISTNLYADASKIGDVTVKVGSSACEVTAKTTDSSTGRVGITCTAPALSAGTYTVTVSIPFYDKIYTVTNGITYVVKTPTTMQNFTQEYCGTMTKNTDSITLPDVRDNNEYTIRRLADGNCWMVTNLMLGNTIKNSGSIEINSSTSDYSGTAFSISASNVMYSGKTNNWTENDYDVLHIYARDATEKDSNGNVYGNLYNFYTTTATSGGTNLTSGDAPYSICPKGWRLPSNGTTAPSYQTLFYVATANGGLGISNNSGQNTEYTDAFQASPYILPITGYWESGELYGTDSWAHYWSRTVGNNGAYSFYFDPQGIFKLTNDDEVFFGFSARCVLATSS